MTDSSFLNEDELPFRYCPGCTHGTVLKGLVNALDGLGLAREKTVAVTDIGCVGLADRYLDMSTFHGLHGRSIAYAMGLKLARPELTVVTLIGDGGVGIGAAHLVAAARRNVGICVVVFNNFNFGMTGGQASATTFSGGRTSTTPDGSDERPLDICALAAASGATFVARVSGFDKGLADVLRAAVSHRGFALVDVWEVCTAHYMEANHFHKAQLEEALARKPSGVLVREEAPEMAAQAHAKLAPAAAPFDPLARFAVPPAEPAALSRPLSLVIAGSAGMKIRYAASLLARAAVQGGLHAAQRDEFPITVLTGYSLADVILSPSPIDHLESEPADLVLALSDDGYARFLARGRPARRVYRTADVAARGPDEIELPRSRERREHVALYGIGRLLEREGLLPPGALRAAVERFGFHGADGREREAQLRAIAG